MKIAVVGGKLQGVEAAYLAHKAGWEVILVDKNKDVPAYGLCDEFYQINVITQKEHLAEVIREAELIIPAIEDQFVLNSLQDISSQEKVPLAFSASAYEITSSKKKSDYLFFQQDIPAPSYWPACNLPVIIKPSDSSGSKGVKKIFDKEDLEECLKQINGNLEDWIIQEYLVGPSYSLEVFGLQGQVITLQVTDLDMDKEYDCKRVLAPTALTDKLEKEFHKIAAQIARLINLDGIMDVEIINHEGVLKVLEIDARLPSQTPTAVYHSTGINMVEDLYQVYVKNELPSQKKYEPSKALVYEHIQVSEEGIETLGEHIISSAGPLKHFYNFYGADEALTNFEIGLNSWVATLIIAGKNQSEAWLKRCEVIENIRRAFDLAIYLDSAPDD